MYFSYRYNVIEWNVSNYTLNTFEWVNKKKKQCSSKSNSWGNSLLYAFKFMRQVLSSLSLALSIPLWSGHFEQINQVQVKWEYLQGK